MVNLSSVLKHLPPGEGELDERAIWPKSTRAFVEFKSKKTNELKILSPQFVVHLTDVKHHGYVLLTQLSHLSLNIV